jgi:hypothetical protein
MFQNDIQFGAYFWFIYIIFYVPHPDIDISNRNFNTFIAEFIKKNHTLVELHELKCISKTIVFRGYKTNVHVLNLTSTHLNVLLW